jgi:NitT/TauT family transport system substrate-binding protein
MLTLMAELGGTELVGDVTALPTGLFYTPPAE